MSKKRNIIFLIVIILTIFLADYFLYKALYHLNAANNIIKESLIKLNNED